jgi:hypothetical protein
MAPKEPITLYFSSYKPGTTERSIAEIQTRSNVNGTYGVTFAQNIPMCDADFKKLTTDIFNFSGSYLPAKDSVNLPATFLETVTIISKPYQTEKSSNMIVATANYPDNGGGSATTVSYVNYTVTGASGKFAGYKNIKILYDNGPESKNTVIIS